MKRADFVFSSANREPAICRELQLFEPSPETVYPIEIASLLANVPRRQILILFKHKLVSPAAGTREQGYYFSGAAIRSLRRIAALRSICGDDFAGIGIILELNAALARLRSEIKALRNKEVESYEEKPKETQAFVST